MQVHHQQDRGCTVLSPVLRTCGSGTMPSLFYLLWIFFLLWFVCARPGRPRKCPFVNKYIAPVFFFA